MCDANNECDVATLVQRHAQNGTIIVTFGNDKQFKFTENWVHHLRALGVGGLLVGMMGLHAAQKQYVAFATSLRALGVGVYTVNSPEVARQPQGGRWFHVLPLLQTGVRVLISDSDVVWLRDPRPYLKRLEAVHPLLDFTVSSDAQRGTDGKRLPTEHGNRRRLRRRPLRSRFGGHRTQLEEALASANDGSAAVGDLDIEAFGHCGQSLNIGIMHFPPGRRPGSLAAIEEAVAHLSAEGNLHRVDQGPINFRWKYGAGKMPAGFRWERPLHAVKDSTGSRLCGMLNGSSIAGVLPSAQFANTLTYSVLQLWRRPGVRPYAVHATWMRMQSEQYKVMRLREEGLWRDGPEWYGAAGDGSSSSETLRQSQHALSLPVGLLVYTPRLSATLVQRAALRRRGGLPVQHMKLIHEQLRQLRDAFFLARSLGRALVLPHMLCSCEMGFFPQVRWRMLAHG